MFATDYRSGPPTEAVAGWNRTRRRRRQRGVATIELLTASVLFLIGLLSIVGLQSHADQLTNDARWRAQAAHHASELVAEMWSMPNAAPGLNDGTADGDVRSPYAVT